MAPVIGATPGTFFSLRHYRKLTTNPLLAFANTLEFVSREIVTSENAAKLIDDWSAFYLALSMADAEMDRAVLSTWVEDGAPYDPDSFITRPLSGLGTRGTITDAMSLNNCLFIRKETGSGNNGKIFIRRFLSEGDTHSPSGTLALLDAPAIQAELTAAITTAGVLGYLKGTEAFQMVMKSALLIEREVNDLVVAGARVMQFNNRYFDVP